MKLFTVIFLTATSLFSQTNDLVNTNSTQQNKANNALLAFQHAEQIRASCLQGRRRICGKIIKVLPEGIVIESGYTNLLRSPLTDAWLIPGTVTATRTPNLIESNEAGSICVGNVLLTDVPKARGKKPKLYDYVILLAYPAGQQTYTSVGTVTKTVRRFTGTLGVAVKLNLAAEEARQPAK